MTREEAINQLKVWAGIISNKTRIEALEMAIEALKKERTTNDAK